MGWDDSQLPATAGVMLWQRLPLWACSSLHHLRYALGLLRGKAQQRLCRCYKPKIKCSFPNRGDQGWETKAHDSHMQHLWRALSPNVLCIQWSGGTFQSCVSRRHTSTWTPVAGSGGTFLELHEVGMSTDPQWKRISNPRCCSPSCSVPGAASAPTLLSPRHEGRAPWGTRLIRAPSQPEPQKQGTGKFMGSGRVFSSDMGRRTWEVRAQQNWGFGDDRLSRRRLRHGLGVGLLASLSWGVACHRPSSTIQPRSSQHVMNCNILTRTHRFQSCNQYTSPLAADVINDANTYFLINLPY